MLGIDAAMSTVRRSAPLWVSAALLCLALASSVQASPRPLLLGFLDGQFQSKDAASREMWFDRAVEAGTGVIRVNVRWASVAPAEVRPVDEADPGSPGYEWEAIDGAVRGAAVRGMVVMFNVRGAPLWAEGEGKPSDAAVGAWKPDPAAYGRFARALATRYSGSYPDLEIPGATLPRVRFYEAWNEPNLDYYLAPQYEKGKLVGPGRYRRLLNSFYAGVKAAQPGAKVIAPATAPYGDRPGGGRTPPVQFLRRLLCLRGGKLRPVRCPAKARFDILSHHPINSVAGPRRSARNPLDASTPDVGRLTRVLRRAERLGSVLPAHKHRSVWGTELWWETDPPDPTLGIPLSRQARYMNITQYVLWQQGVSVAIFLPMVDAPAGKNIAVSLQSGIFFEDGRRKPSFEVIRFPFVAQRLRGDRALAWGRAPRRGRVAIQRRTGSGWRTIAHARGRPGVPFRVLVRLRGGAVLRAASRGVSSRATRLRARRLKRP